MSRLYSANFEAVAVTALQDLFELTAADDKPIELHGVFIGQSSDAGDAEEEFLRWAVIRGNTTSGSGGTAATEESLRPNTAATGTAVEVNNTTEASAGTEDELHMDTFNTRHGIDFWWTPEARPATNQAAGLIVVRLLTAPADELTMSGTIYYAEVD